MKITYIKTGKRMKERKNKNITNEEQNNITVRQEIIDNYTKEYEKSNANSNNNYNKEYIMKKPKKQIRNIVAKKPTEQIRNRLTKNKRKGNKQNEEKRKELMRAILKRNQIVILTLALMLITAGYMNYNNSMKELNMSLGELGDAKLVSTNLYDNDIKADENVTDINYINNINVGNIDNNKNSNEIDKVNNNIIVGDNNQTVDTNETNEIQETSNKTSGDYFTQTRLDRESMYSQMLETYQKILENEKVPVEQKAIASNEIKNINDRKNAISIAENLIKAKGFKDVTILINDNSINVVAKQEKNLTEEQVAQITNIVSRELKAEIEDIHISVHK